MLVKYKYHKIGIKFQELEFILILERRKDDLKEQGGIEQPHYKMHTK